jgi:hypothetical protein
VFSALCARKISQSICNSVSTVAQINGENTFPPQHFDSRNFECCFADVRVGDSVNVIVNMSSGGGSKGVKKHVAKAIQLRIGAKGYAAEEADEVVHLVKAAKANGVDIHQW